MKEYKLMVNGKEYAVNIIDVKENVAHLTVNGAEYNVEIGGLNTAPKKVVNRGVQVPTLQSQSQAPVKKPAAAAGGAANALKTPLPGVVLDVFVQEGDAVKAGQRVLLLEAMKMENNIEADRDGVVEKISVRKGDSVLEGDVLLTIK